jgi:hypothetical protein
VRDEALWRVLSKVFHRFPQRGRFGNRRARELGSFGDFVINPSH